MGTQTRIQYMACHGKKHWVIVATNKLRKCQYTLCCGVIRFFVGHASKIQEQWGANEWNQINQIHNIQQKYLVKWSSAELLLFVVEATWASTETVILTSQVKLSHSENYHTSRWEIWTCLRIFRSSVFDKLVRASKAEVVADAVADDNINSSMKIELMNSKKSGLIKLTGMKSWHSKWLHCGADVVDLGHS